MTYEKFSYKIITVLNISVSYAMKGIKMNNSKAQTNKNFRVKNWFFLNLRAGLLSILYYTVNYGLMLGLSYLLSVLLPQYEHITKWVIIGLWGVVNILIVIAYILTMVWGEDTCYFVNDSEKLQMDSCVLDGISYNQAMSLVKKVKSKKRVLYSINVFSSMLICYSVIIVGYAFMRYSINLFHWAKIMETALNFELYTLIGISVLYFIALSIYQFTDTTNDIIQNDIENATRRYCWKNCKNCGGLVTKEILSVDVKTDNKEVLKEGAHVEYNKTYDKFKINGTKYTVESEKFKNVGPKYVTVKEKHYMVNAIATCRQCGNTYEEKGEMKNIDYRTFYKESGEKVVFNDPEKSNKITQQKNKRV